MRLSNELPVCPTGPDLIAFMMDRIKPATAAAYRSDLLDYFGGDLSPESVLSFVRMPPSEIANSIEQYRLASRAKGLGPATINRRLAALRALLRCAREIGLADVITEFRGEQLQMRRDSAPLAGKQVREILEAAGTETLRGLRDTAILRLLCGSALRTSEIVALNVRDFNADRPSIRVSTRHGHQILPLNIVSAGLIVEYLRRSGHCDRPTGPLFCSLDHRPEHRGGRITVKGIQHLVSGYARLIGAPVTASMLRYTAVRTALAVTGGDIGLTKRCCRMTDVKTMARWERDRRTEIDRRQAAVRETTVRGNADDTYGISPVAA